MSIDGIPWQEVSTEDVLKIHAAEMERSNGRRDPPHDGCIERSIGGTYQAVLYGQGDDGPDLLMAAGYLLFYLAKNHCFIDGNKRAGWSAMVHLLYINGIRIKAPQDEATKLVEAVAESQDSPAKTVAMIITWLSVAGRLEANES